MFRGWKAFERRGDENVFGEEKSDLRLNFISGMSK